MSATMTQTMTRPTNHFSTHQSPTVDLDSYDEEQVRLMEERCILITPNDEAYGEDSKKTCAL
jgi:isopentenyl-diphosphate delta-isomerase